jgi:MerR family transcriptional regulator, copper efflux regulator
MNIGKAAKLSGLPAKMIRYYEAIGMVPPQKRLRNGYRQYDMEDVHRLRFVQGPRNVGLSVSETAELLSLWSDRERSSSTVKKLALTYIDRLEVRAAEVRDMIRTFTHPGERFRHNYSCQRPGR